MDGTRLGFGVLGPLLMSVDGTPAPSGAPKQRAVLATLVLSQNRPVAMDSLITAVWDKSPVPAARATIQSYVSNLRRLFSDAGLDPHGLLPTVPPGYRLNIAETECDLGRFNIEKTTGAEAAAAGRFDDASRHLTAALAEWRGPVLEDLPDFAYFEPWVTALTEDKLQVHTAHAEAEIVCGRAQTIISDLEKLCAGQPYREPLWVQLITAYYVAKRRSDALDAYRRLKTALAEDLGIDPDPSVDALHQQILRQEPLDTARAAQTSAVQTLSVFGRGVATRAQPAMARLRDNAGGEYLLNAAATRIGRLSDSDIVLNDSDVSRQHAAIIDTGTSFLIMDLRSANGVEVQGRRIATSTNLADGDRIRIGSHEFIFEIH